MQLTRPRRLFQIRVPSRRFLVGLLTLLCSVGLFGFGVVGITGKTRASEPPLDDEPHWSLRPIVKPDVPSDVGERSNPIDAFIARSQTEIGAAPLPRANKLALLRRVTVDLIGLPPTLEEQQDFLNDESDSAYEIVVQRLLDSRQHGVRYARHWLDIMRYADIDSNGGLGGNIPAGDKLYLWRDWVIASLNDDMPYDEFVRAQITGYRDSERTTISATGFRRRKQPRPDDAFALGFLSRGATSNSNKDEALALSAVETISTAFMGMTVGCAKCHDHFYDPIEQQDFYAMKALFDPLRLQPVQLATATEIFENGRQQTEFEREKKRIERQIDSLTGEYHTRLYHERVGMLPPDVQAVIRKPEKVRTADEQKTADEYYPVLRIDSGKLREILPEDVKKQYDRLQREVGRLRQPKRLPVFWTVAEDEIRKQQPRYILNSGDAERPEKDSPVEPGFPFSDPESVKFDEGLREGFVDWLTAPENPLFARVVVNRIWQWHFGHGLHQKPSDFGRLGGNPIHPDLLDWLTAEFIAHEYSMKWLHHMIVTSEAYQRASAEEACNNAAATERNDPSNKSYWKFPIQRLDAESIWDAIHFAADDLDVEVGGASFEPRDNREFHDKKKRRAAYMQRGFRAGEEVMPEFLRIFDVDDGRLPCPVRVQSVTATQSLLLMNSPLLERAAGRLADRVRQQMASEPADDDLSAAVAEAYRLTLCRPPTDSESALALAYFDGDPAKLQQFCWLLFNLDEFMYVP